MSQLIRTLDNTDTNTHLFQAPLQPCIHLHMMLPSSTNAKYARTMNKLQLRVGDTLLLHCKIVESATVEDVMCSGPVPVV